MSTTSPSRDGSSSSAAPPPRRRRFIQIRLRWLLLLPLLLGVPLAIVVGYHRSAKHQEAVVRQAEDANVRMVAAPFAVDSENFEHANRREPSFIQGWMETHFGPHYAYPVEVIEVDGLNISLDQLKKMRGVRCLFGRCLSEEILLTINPTDLEQVEFPRPDMRAGTGTAISRRSLEHLARAPRLKVLRLAGCTIGDDELKLLQHATELQYLDVSFTYTRGAFLQKLPTQSLKALRISNNALDAQACHQISRFTQLRQLSIANTGVDDECLRQLVLPELTNLTIAKNPITDNALSGFKEQFPQLTVVGFHSGQVSRSAIKKYGIPAGFTDL